MDRDEVTTVSEDYTPGHVFTNSRRSNSLGGTLSRPKLSGTDTPFDAEQTSRKGDVKLHIGSDDSSVEILEPIPEDNRLYLEYVSVNAWVPSVFNTPSLLPKLNFKRGQEKKDEQKSSMRQILFNITGCCRPGEVLALMGPSGSGKTSLLSVIGGRAQKMMIKEGEVTFNGSKLNKRLKRQIGYVLQDDLLYESLTVYETLYYAAMLRLPRKMTAEQKKERVMVVIKALGIESCKDTIIGGFFRKGISGGERKRVSIGHELLINPSIMLLDEPTSGLDSTTAMHLLSTLRQLAVGGRAICTTIHQPSSRLYQQLDKLLLLSKGHVMYYGRGSQADDWFDKLGYTLPYRVNVADFILDLSSADVYTDKRDGEQSRTFLIECAEAYSAKHPLDGYDPTTASTEVTQIRTALSAAPNSSALDGVPPAGKPAQPRYSTEQSGRPISPFQVASVETGTEASSSTDGEPVDEEVGAAAHRTLASSFKRRGVPQAAGNRWGASYPQQLKILFVRSVRTRRFQSLSKQDLIQFLVVGVLTGLFWLQRAGDDTLGAAQDTLGLLFFELLFLSFRTMFVALFTFPDEFKMLLKERASGMYRLSAFYFARTASDLPMDFSIPTLFIILVYFLGGLRYSASAFFANYFTVMLVALVSQSFGLLLGTAVMNPKTAQTIASILMLTFLLTGGYFVKSIPVWISWLKYLSFVYYGWGLLVHIEYAGRTIYSCPTATDSANGGVSQVNVADPASSPQCTPVSNLQSALGLGQPVDSMKWQAINACVLLGFLLFFRFLVYVMLRKKTSRV
ncbi:hypothetical protein WJX72_009913 [[Myrmecia] bisecta]|uniref:ABC transporter domain-containing protein n=1 Tax=[Myrmecia] bisecta TaxID=41462 RepID=A0AAW1QGF2_9CHLO